MIKNKVFEGKILMFKTYPSGKIPYYKVTTWYDDGSVKESEMPAYDVPIITYPLSLRVY